MKKVRVYGEISAVLARPLFRGAAVMLHEARSTFAAQDSRHEATIHKVQK